MIPRTAADTLIRLARGFPIVALTGPRQTGKTTLARAVFPDKAYVSLENPEEREFAENDPRRFLQRFSEGAILDEVQRCPSLLSWLQGMVDERGRMGDFILTGSAQFELVSGMTQSLAGRVGRVELLPLAADELASAGKLPQTLDEMLFCGGYPALYDRMLSPDDWFPNYVATYLERDVRQLIAIRDLSQFQRFVKMCAARSGQMLNLTALGADCGVSAVTAREWLTVLEASYLVMRLPPYHRNFGKRLVKTPKLYFLDVGLMAWLLGIRDVATIETHTFFDTQTLPTISIYLQENNDTDVLFGGAMLSFLGGDRLVYRPPRLVENSLWHGLPSNHQATYYRITLLKKTPYDLAYPLCGDYFLAAKLMHNGARELYLNAPLAIFEVGGQSYRKLAQLFVEPYRIQRDVLASPMYFRLASALKRLISTLGFVILSHPFFRAKR